KLNHIFRVRQLRINEDFTREGDAPGLHKKCEWKPRGQAEAFLIFPPSPKRELDLRLQLRFGRNQGKICGLVTDARRLADCDPAQFAVGELEPLPFWRTPRRHRKSCRHPAPAVALLFFLNWDCGHG